jgi:hypothetical protein
MVKAPQKEEGPGKPYVFLVLSTIFVIGAIMGYVYEDELFINRPYLTPTFSHDVNVYFFGILFFSLAGAFASLFAFLNPRIGNKILGRGPVKPTRVREKTGTVTYSVFSDTTAKSIKAQHRARKTSRHERRRYAKATKKPEPKKED